MALNNFLLNTQQYQVRFKDKAIQGKGQRPPLQAGVVAIEKGNFWSPSTTVATFTLLIITYQKWFS